MQILITGGAGFIGSSLADRLLKEHTVIVIDNFNAYYDPALKEANVRPHLHHPRYTLYRADICDGKALRNVFSTHPIDVVVHIAARAGVRPSLEDPLSYVRTNIEGTVQVLQLMKEFHVPKMVFASSSSVYGNCQAEKFSEDLKIMQPISPYAATKSACEQILYTYSKLYAINCVALRFFTVYGPRQRPDLAIHKFIEHITANQPIEMYGDGNTMRDYTYIDDIVNGICAAITYNKTPYEIINLGGGSPITLRQMIQTIEEILGEKAIIHQLPMQPGDVNKTVADISKAKKLLNYQPATDFKTGIKHFVNWRKELCRKHTQM